MSCYVANHEELFLQGFAANEMTQPLSAIICVAIFPVNFHIQRNGLQLTPSPPVTKTTDPAASEYAADFHAVHRKFTFITQGKHCFLRYFVV